MKKFVSFTLAEVLITLVIIGIITAILVPVVIQNHKKTETSTKLKKFYSTMSNALRLAETEEGVPFAQWEMPVDTPTFDTFFKQHFSKYFSYYKTTDRFYLADEDENGEWTTPYKGPIDTPFYFVYLNDGTIMSFSGDLTYGHLYIYIDINGEKRPNEAGRDIFGFDLYSQGDIDYYKEHYGFELKHLVSYLNYNWTKQEIIDGCAQSMDNVKDPDPAWACSYLLQSSGWEFTKDYKKRL